MKQHWADIYAAKVIREQGDSTSQEKKQLSQYTCASGITPSGTVHIGNFREIISVELVVRALRDMGVTPRFIYSWDDFDVFRKVPTNLPKTSEFEQYLRMPITDIPDPWQRAESYALGNEHDIEKVLAVFGIHPHYIYQAEQYRNGKYAEGIRKALVFRSEIKAIMDKYRTSPLPDDWWPISVFSAFSKKDTSSILNWDGEWNIRYRCNDTGKEDTIDIRTSKLLKLLWRIDWPMRWDYEKVVFEPAGKDHHSQGGSFDTARDIVSKVYDYQAPITFQYGFVRIKGGGGKLSSSSGEVVSISDVLEVYEPEIIRHFFAGTRPEVEFAISFDLDVIKIYEDYDRCERIYFGEEEVGEQRKIKESRIYEFSQIDEIPKTMPLQIPMRHLCNLLQTRGGNFDGVLGFLSEEYSTAIIAKHKKKLHTRMQCAWNWIQQYAPEDFKFSLRKLDTLTNIQETIDEQHAVRHLRKILHGSWDDELSDKDINTLIYDSARDRGIEPTDFFTTLYRRLIAKDKGPRLGSFLKFLGKNIVLEYLDN